ncbi:MAG: 16S rRNA (cytidine(1402)-2'-O)-methyltransferase [Deltaproteobacteria bacterium]|nr:MAG: 16S rRNA (cytidine(1402)-2'-O)-methyltransferase [Deltaproteobacteria bacterium]
MPSGARHEEKGILYVVSTPIGNLEDITLRAIRILREVDMIAAENISRTRVLLNHYDIKKELISYRRENQKGITQRIIKSLNSGYKIALVSDAGTPGISDPGSYLVSKVMQEGLKVVPIPGVSAITAAISVSGMSQQGFVFIGFLPSTTGKRKKRLNSLKSEILPVIIFEAPHRLIKTLREIRDIMGNREIVLLKELTKLHEHITRGHIDDILKRLEGMDIKGEYVIIVSGKSGEPLDRVDEESLFLMDRMLRDGLSTRDVANIISREGRVPYRRAYKKCLERKRLFYGSQEKA